METTWLTFSFRLSSPQVDEHREQPFANQGGGGQHFWADARGLRVHRLAAAGGRDGDQGGSGAAGTEAARARHHPARWAARSVRTLQMVVCLLKALVTGSGSACDIDLEYFKIILPFAASVWTSAGGQSSDRLTMCEWHAVTVKTREEAPTCCYLSLSKSSAPVLSSSICPI